MASDITSKFSRDFFGDRMKIKDPFEWTSESYNLAVKYVYPFFEKNTNITGPY